MRFVFLCALFSGWLFGANIYASYDCVAKDTSSLALQTMGIVKNIKVNVGDKVKKGQLLLELDYSLENTQLLNAKADLKLAQIAKEHAKSSLNKFNQVKNVVDKQAYENVLFEYNKAEQSYEKAKLNIRYYEELISKKKLYAPYDGVISAKFINKAEGVGGVAQPLLQIISSPKSKLIVSIDDIYIKDIKVGQVYKYKVGQTEKEAKIDLIYPTIDTKNRKVLAEVYVDGVIPGSFGEGYIVVGN